jgi:hypothetical protein
VSFSGEDVFVTPMCALVSAHSPRVTICAVPCYVCKGSVKTTADAWVHVRDDVDLFPLCLFGNARCQLRRSCLDTPTWRDSGDDDFDAVFCQRICDTAPILYARQVLSSES